MADPALDEQIDETVRWVEQTLGEPPLLLLDDFGSELDPDRRRSVLSELRGSLQAIVTATNPADLGPSDLFDAIGRMDAGAIAGG